MPHVPPYAQQTACPFCQRYFFDRSTMKRHMKRHFVDRETYDCKPCGKSFTRKDKLRDHIRSAKHRFVLQKAGIPISDAFTDSDEASSTKDHNSDYNVDSPGSVYGSSGSDAAKSPYAPNGGVESPKAGATPASIPNDVAQFVERLRKMGKWTDLQWDLTAVQQLRFLMDSAEQENKKKKKNMCMHTDMANKGGGVVVPIHNRKLQPSGSRLLSLRVKHSLEALTAKSGFEEAISKNKSPCNLTKHGKMETS